MFQRLIENRLRYLSTHISVTKCDSKQKRVNMWNSNSCSANRVAFWNFRAISIFIWGYSHHERGQSPWLRRAALLSGCACCVRDKLIWKSASHISKPIHSDIIFTSAIFLSISKEDINPLWSKENLLSILIPILAPASAYFTRRALGMECGIFSYKKRTCKKEHKEKDKRYTRDK